MKQRKNIRKGSQGKRAKDGSEAALDNVWKMFLRRLKRVNGRQFRAFLILFIYLAGLGSGFLLWRRPTAETVSETTVLEEHAAHIALGQQVNPPEGYTLKVEFGDAGPRLLAAGAIDRDAFVQINEDANRTLTDAQLAILEQGSETQIVLNKQNAYFLLNFFWALGLVNHNTILTEGPMAQNGEDQIERFASTGGWTLGTKPAMELYASTQIVTLTTAQQQRLEEVTTQVYRPCCNNPPTSPTVTTEWRC
jgi:hypothetical protein